MNHFLFIPKYHVHSLTQRIRTVNLQAYYRTRLQRGLLKSAVSIMFAQSCFIGVVCAINNECSGCFCFPCSSSWFCCSSGFGPWIKRTNTKIVKTSDTLYCYFVLQLRLLFLYLVLIVLICGCCRSCYNCFRW